MNHRTGKLFGTTCVCASLCDGLLLMILHFCPSVLARPSAAVHAARRRVQKQLRSCFSIDVAVRWAIA